MFLVIFLNVDSDNESEHSIYELACLVIVILLIASLNYVLLTVSNAASRSQEVGVRKVMGAKRKSIVLLFWIETQIVVTFAVVFGLVLSRAFLPLFNSAIGTRLNFNSFSWTEIFLASLILCLLLGVLAGYYPALLISKMKPVSIVKSFQTFKINPRFSRVLVVFQYTACVILMVAAFVINRQMEYINNRDLGFDKDQILMVRNPTWDPEFTTRVRDRLAAFSETEPSILQFSGMNGSLDGSGNENGFQLNGEQKHRKTYTVEYNYFKMLGLKFIQGRPFSRSIGSDSIRSPRRIVVNETLFNLLGKNARLNEYNEALDGVIIGVVKDYHFESLTKKIDPEEHRLAGDFMMSFMFKIRAGQMQTAISRIQKEWKQVSNNYPFEFTFMDETIAKMYEADLRWQQTIQASCFFAILIACMGLFGLSAINVANRTKEIGIRKVLGAGLKDIVLSLSKNFILLVSISILLAAPVAWWILNKWLEDFAYRTNISWWMILLVGCSSLAIAMLTVGFHAVKASLANPVKSLRTE
ncbi:MAG: ABC transporter permease [Chitinophagales bacterium]